MPRNKCLALLARREYSQLELKQRLLAKGFELESILATIAVLVEEGLQSDTRYAESFVRLRKEAGMGPLKIRYELTQNGVSPQVIQTALSQFDWDDVCATVMARRLNVSYAQLSFKEKVSFERFLLGRGFNKSQIKNALLIYVQNLIE